MIPCSMGEERKITAQVEHVEVADESLLIPEHRRQAEKHLVRLLDMRLLPTVILIYLMNYTDVSSWFNDQ